MHVAIIIIMVDISPLIYKVLRHIVLCDFGPLTLAHSVLMYFAYTGNSIVCLWGRGTVGRAMEV